jgi:ATP-dependent Zn protease
VETSNAPKRRRIAWHEAAHAVAGWALGYEVEELWIEAGLSIGHATIPEALRTTAPWRHKVVVLFAGGVGGNLSGEPIFDKHETLDDEHWASNYVPKDHPDLSDPDDDEALDRILLPLREEAENLVEANRDALQTLANELFNEGRLSADQARSILSKFRPHGNR